MAYFSQFPLMAYDVAGNQNYKLLPNILKRVKLRSGLRSGSFLFDNYDVKDGEKPEDIAFKWFGDAQLHWVILMTNNITDRYYQWPLTQPQFQEHLEDKYGQVMKMQYIITRYHSLVVQHLAMVLVITHTWLSVIQTKITLVSSQTDSTNKDYRISTGRYAY